MRLLQIGFLDPYENIGGVERYIQNLSIGLHSTFGYRVDILVAGPENSEKETDAGRVITLKVPFFGTRYFFLAKYFYARRVRAFIRASMQEYDLFHFHGDNGFIGRYFAGKSILTLHGVARTTSSMTKRITSALPAKIEVNNVKLAKEIFAVSSEAGNFFTQYTGTQIKVIKQSIDTEFYRPVSPAERQLKREHLCVSTDQVVGLIVGTDPVRKGLDIAIKAVEQLQRDDLTLFAIGFPTKEHSGPRIRILGRVDEPTKLAYLQIADFFIFPSHKEGFPISVLEAASVGLPLIVSKNSNASELGETVPYFDEIDSFDPSDYRKGIERFIEFSEKNGIADIIQDRKLLEQYSVSTLVKIYSNAYKSLLAPPTDLLRV